MLGKGMVYLAHRDQQMTAKAKIFSFLAPSKMMTTMMMMRMRMRRRVQSFLLVMMMMMTITSWLFLRVKMVELIKRASCSEWRHSLYWYF